jgi:hyperosmotically inducible periplasmic protein
MTATTWIRRSGAFALSAMLVTTVAAASPAPQERAADQAKETARQTGNAIKDSWITMKVHSQFVPEDALEGSDIDVDTNAGVVTLTGTVVTDAGRARALAIAKATDGVKSVNDKLRVAPAESATASAREAGRTAGEAARETGRSAGEAAREAGRTAGEAARETGRTAREAAGTSGRVVTDGWIKSKIYSQFITEDALDDADIDVDITKGAVTLSGSVPTEAARARAASIAKATDGVKSVNNNLKVAR